MNSKIAYTGCAFFLFETSMFLFVFDWLDIMGATNKYVAQINDVKF